MHFFRELLRLNPLIDGLSDNPTESNLAGDGGRWLHIRELFCTGIRTGGGKAGPHSWLQDGRGWVIGTSSLGGGRM